MHKTTKISILAILFLTIANWSIASEINLKTSIKEVTLYLKGAHIMREGKITLPAGKSVVKAKTLSPYLDAQSLLVNGKGNFTLVSVNTSIDYSKTTETTNEEDSLLQIVKKQQTDLDKLTMRLPILDEMESLLISNKNLSSQQNGITASNLKSVLDLFNSELTAIKDERFAIKDQEKQLVKAIANTRKQMLLTEEEEALNYYEVVLEVEAPQQTMATFTFSYLVENALWIPNYNVRVNDLSAPVELSYFADVYQNTGEDWEGVKLSFSNGTPNTSGVAPVLETWFLDFKRNTVFDKKIYGDIKAVNGRITDENGEPLIGANVIVSGTSIGTVCDVDGNYKLTLPANAESIQVSYLGYDSRQVRITKPTINVMLNAGVVLDQVVVSGYSKGKSKNVFKKEAKPKIQAKVPEIYATINPINFEFTLSDPFSIKSGDQKSSIKIKDYKIDATYTHYAVPKKDEHAYLMASINNWNSYNLLDGEANIYFDDTYVSRTVLESSIFADTLKISLGQDKSIGIERSKNNDFCTTKVLSSNKTTSIGFDIKLRNNRKQIVNLLLYDQIPVAQNDDISVKTLELSNASLDEKTGEVLWKLTMQPLESQNLQLAYEVKYPKREAVYLE